MNEEVTTPFSRTELLLGKEGMDKLSGTRVIIFGIGGVGGHAFEALVRSGIGSITAVDPDRVSLTNLNRQILATRSSMGRLKVEVARERALDINPDITVNILPIFYSEETADEINLSDYDYIIDAIDAVKSKLLLIEKATRLGIPIISSMGAGGKTDPARFRISDIYKTSVCPLARVMRTELKRRGIKKLKVVFSDEPPIKTVVKDESGAPSTRNAPGSIATVPSVAGLIIAAEVISDITK